MRPLLCTALLLAAAACDPEAVSDTAPAEEGLTADFPTLHEKVLVPNCAQSGCHSTADRLAELALEDIDEAYDALLNEPCTNETAIIEGLLRVAPGDPDQSFLYIKLTDARGMGTEMPPAYELTEEEIAAMEEWILNGAER